MDYVSTRSILNFPVRILKIHWGTFEKIDFENVKNSKILNFKVDFHQNAKFQVEYFSFKSKVRTLKKPCKTKNRFGTHLKSLLKKFENYQFSKKTIFLDHPNFSNFERKTLLQY